MKIKSGQLIPNSEIQKIQTAFESTKGGPNYTEYYMEVNWYDFKHKAWKYLGHGVPITNLDGRIKIFKGTAWLVIEKSSDADILSLDKQRFRLTSKVLDLMGWEI